ncbi:MAG: hypothetical protein A2Y38_00015 [Spirochaetes bacterium GWB1_59_5]|nr:MAG: hypothetical protein A2Y38_00015 [Spirochaetes bacterium GWB1_59_5]
MVAPFIKYRSRPNFRMLAPVYPYGTDPSRDNPAFHPAVKRSTFQVAHWSTTGGGMKGRMAPDVGYQMAQVTVAYGVDTTIESGESILRIGPYEIRPWVDYTPVDADAAATATALAAAVDNLPGFTGIDLGGGVVEIRTTSQLDRIPVEVMNLDFAHLTLGTTDTGYLVRVTSTGAPRFQTPDIT